MVRTLITYITLLLLISCNSDQSKDNRILMYHNYKKAISIPSGLEKLFKEINFDTIKVSSIVKDKNIIHISNQEYIEFLYKQDSINKSFDEIGKTSDMLKDTSHISFVFYAIGKFKPTKNIVTLIVLLERISEKRFLNRYDDAIFILNLKSNKLCSIAEVADNKGAFFHNEDVYITTFVDNCYFKKEQWQCFSMDYLVNENNKSWFQDQWYELRNKFRPKYKNPYSSFGVSANGQIELQ